MPVISRQACKLTKNERFDGDGGEGGVFFRWVGFIFKCGGGVLHWEVSVLIRRGVSKNIVALGAPI